MRGNPYKELEKKKENLFDANKIKLGLNF